MALPVTFASLAAGNEPASLLDQNFNAVAAMGAIQCVASGTNAITAVPIANMPVVTGYANYQSYGFIAANTNTAGTPTLLIGSGTARNLYKDTSSGPTVLAIGDIVAGNYYQVVFDSSLNTGAGGFHVVQNPLLVFSSLSNSLAADVNLNNIATYFDGPSVAQGTSGTWYASGTVTLLDPASTGPYIVQLTDGVTIKATTVVQQGANNFYVSASLSGEFSSPAGNIRMSVKDTGSTSGKILANASTLAKDSTITVERRA